MIDEIYNNYCELLSTKQKQHIQSGFECNDQWDWLYPFQSHCVRKALKYGKFALFEDCGLGKTRQQITWAYEVVKYAKAPVLILAPLAIVGQTIKEGNSI